MNMRYAGFWVRLVAYLIDALILGVVGVIIGLIGGLIAFATGEWILILVYLFLMALSLGYMIIMPATSFKGTFGKVLMGIQIVDGNGEQIGIGKSILRYIGFILNGFTMNLSFLIIAFHPEKKGLQDLIAGTYVVTRK